MKRLLVLLPALLLALPALGSTSLAQYGVSRSFDFVLFNADGTLDVDEADGGAEITLDCGNTPTNPITNDFTDEGSYYKITLTAAEMGCARLTVTVAATLTSVFHIETYGHPLAAHPEIGGQIIAYGLAQSGGATSIQLAAATSFADDFLNNKLICIRAGAAAGQCRLITDWVSATDTATVELAWTTTNPDSTSYYYVYESRQAYVAVDSSGAVDANMTKLSGDSAAADALETFADGSPVAQTGDVYPLVDTEISDILIETGDLDTDVDAVLSRVGIPSNFGSGATLADNNVDIEGFVDNLPSDPADDSDIDAQLATIVADTNEAQISLAAGGLIESMVDDLQIEVDGIQADTEDLQARTPAALVGGRTDASVGAIAANTMTAAAAAADLTTELQTGLATASAVSTLQTSVDDLPTNAELATSQAAADDATLAAIAALDDLSSAQVQTAAAAALTAYDSPTRAELTSDVNALDALLDRVLGGTVSFSSAITGVTSQTALVTNDDPGPDQTYLNRRVCVEDLTTGYNDCAWVNGYDTDTNTWTLSNALRFTVATSDVLRILPVERTF